MDPCNPPEPPGRGELEDWLFRILGEIRDRADPGGADDDDGARMYLFWRDEVPRPAQAWYLAQKPIREAAERRARDEALRRLTPEQRRLLRLPEPSPEPGPAP